MKKLVLSICVLLGVTATQAQKLGVIGGVNFAKLNVTDEHFKNLAGGYGGVVVEQGLGKRFALQSGLIYASKGGADKHDGHMDKFQFMTLQIPVLAAYKIPVGKNTITIGAGPVLDIHTSGKLKSDDASENTTFNFGNGAGEFKRTDLGIGAVAGLEFKNGVFIQARGTFGLTDLDNVANGSVRSNVFGINGGYYFLRGKK